MRTYRRSRKDNPKGVVGVYDHGGKTMDRYTVVFEPFESYGSTYFPCLYMSDAPFNPQGVCMHGVTEGYRITGGWGTGRKVIPFTDLPPDCQRAVRLDLEED